jgi:SAM-dependent methyltransferase
VLKDRLSSSDTVIDYGCGPGFLAKIVSENVAKVFALDISPGALACAQVLNPSPNLAYVLADESGLCSIENDSVDVVFSYAVIQHLSDATYNKMLDNCWSKLRPGGRILLHIQLIDPLWKTEDEWRADKSLQGRLKFKYGLHCFGRTIEDHVRLVRNHGFIDVYTKPLTELVDDEAGSELVSQSILTATKPA